VNHQYYSDHHPNYTYIFDISPTNNGIFKNKLEKLRKLLPLFDYIFWIDDDAFFMQQNIKLEDLISPNHDLTFCSSPKNNGAWTYLSSGNFFLKNTDKVKRFLDDCIALDVQTAKNNWDEEKFGAFTNGDQDLMVYLLHFDDRYKENFHITLPFEKFNTRPFHFTKSHDEHFLVHFTGENKNDQVKEFAKKYSLSHALIPTGELQKYKGIYEPQIENSNLDSPSGSIQKSFFGRLKR
jgi:hypothetical protein